MTTEDFLDNFGFGNTFKLKISDYENLEFNILSDKETTIEESSLICYTKRDPDIIGRSFKNVTKTYYSLNPMEDIKNDKAIFDTFDDILIRVDSISSDDSKNYIEKIKSFYSL